MLEIIISRINNIRKIFILENGKIIEQYDEDIYAREKIGEIYNGKIKNIKKGLEAVFVDIGEKKNVFMHTKDIIQEYPVEVGQNILVQIKRNETKYKSAKVSNKNISITGKYVILLPNVNFITVSKKINDCNERNRLKILVQKYLPNNMGAIIRTAAQNKKDLEIEKDINNLKKRWSQILDLKCDKPGLVYNMDSLIRKILIDLTDRDISKIVIDNEDDYVFVKKIIDELEESIGTFIDRNLIQSYNIEKVLREIKKKKIWLKCGGFIVIEKTEALTAIDVNSGKYVGKNNLRETVFKVNKEASEEIAKQIRLRDISGIIVVDYIDMNNDDDKEKIRNILIEEMKKDRSRIQVYDFTKLNLLEITRKKMYSHSEEEQN